MVKSNQERKLCNLTRPLGDTGKKNFPESEETQKGHMRKQLSGLRSTTRKPKSHRDAVKAFATAAAAEEKEAATAARAMTENDDNEIQNPNEMQNTRRCPVKNVHESDGQVPNKSSIWELIYNGARRN
jgi:hypothetical protein